MVEDFLVSTAGTAHGQMNSFFGYWPAHDGNSRNTAAREALSM